MGDTRLLRAFGFVSFSRAAFSLASSFSSRLPCGLFVANFFLSDWLLWSLSGNSFVMAAGLGDKLLLAFCLASFSRLGSEATLLIFSPARLTRVDLLSSFLFLFLTMEGASVMHSFTPIFLTLLVLLALIFSSAGISSNSNPAIPASQLLTNPSDKDLFRSSSSLRRRRFRYSKRSIL